MDKKIKLPEIVMLIASSAETKYSADLMPHS